MPRNRSLGLGRFSGRLHPLGFCAPGEGSLAGAGCILFSLVFYRGLTSCTPYAAHRQSGDGDIGAALDAGLAIKIRVVLLFVSPAGRCNSAFG